MEGVNEMKRREMRQRISATIGVHVSGVIAGYNRKTLAEELEIEFEIICKFKKPTYSMRRRWERAISEVAEQLIRKDPYFRESS